MAVVVLDGGGGGDGRREIETAETEFFVKVDGEELHPVLVTNLEMESSGDTTSITVDCGDTERRKTANAGWIITVEGLVSTNDVRPDNLSVQKLRDDIKQRDVVDIRSPIFSGTIVLSNIIINSPESAVEAETSRTWDRERVWGFRMVLGEEESDA